ncbi:nephrin-like [Amphibalanus amphitrite]|nr:nephrin-like [Amphibalanus amphitrite]
MLGDPGSGVHDLEVTNVTLEDDGRFQCQVSPNRGQDAIRADAILTVLVKPRAVRVSSSARSPRPGQYETRVGGEVTLTCDVIGARPAAQVRWERDGIPIQPARRDSFSGWGHPGRNDTTSVVTLRPTAADDGAGISCVAQHPAIAPEDQQYFNSTIILSVLYAPGAPTITDHTEGEWVSVGEQKTLTCVSVGGNPPADLVWFRNGQPVTYQYRAQAGRAMAQLVLTVERDDHGAEFRCEASSKMHPAPMVTHAQLNVQFGPERVTVSGTQEARGGDTVHMSCITSSSNPPANITWVINGRTMMNMSQSHAPSPAGSGWVTRSNMSTMVPPGLQEDMLVSCHALNPRLGVTKQGAQKVTVLHPPEPPTILGYESGSHLRAGERVSLSCVSQGGNPPATLTWYRGDTELASSTEVRDSVARSVVTFQVDHADNGRAYTCHSTNSAITGVQSASVTLSVFFPPSSLKLEVRPDVLRAGSQALLTCESRPSYPAAELTWWRDNVQVTDGVTALETFKAGSMGGTSSRVQLRRNLTTSDDGTVYQCRSETRDVAGDVRDQVTLNVHYPPTFPKRIYTEDIEEGESRRINITARGNPGDISYHWYRVSTIDGTRVMGHGPVLNVVRVAREDAGLYYLEAINSEGNSSVSVSINVQYKPELIAVSESAVVSPGVDGVLSCSASANPSPPDLITWHREGFDFSSPRVNIHSRNGTSYLTLYNVTKEDSGRFECRAANELGQTEARTALLVRHAVELEGAGRVGRAAAQLGDTAQVPCRARGVPNVTFEWSTNGTAILTAETGKKYQQKDTQIDLVTWQSVLRIKDVQPSDYATYECVALNELGSQRQQIELGRPSAPDPPLGLKVVNVSHDSATVAWEAGFDGGQEQRYKLRYRQSPGTEYHYDPVPSSSGTQFTVTGLRASTRYTFSVMAYNTLGSSAYSQEVTAKKTASPPPVSYVTDRDEPGGPAAFPRVAVISVTAVGALLLILNVIFIGCYRRRRHLKKQKAASEASTKSETLHMYGNETVSSVSVKSGGSYSREDSVADFEDDMSRRRYDTFLSDSPLEPPVEYGGRPSSPDRADYEPPEQYADALRRNSYACTMGAGVEPMSSKLNTTYVTQPPRAPHFRPSALDAPTPDLLHSSGPGSGYFPPEPPAGPGRHYSTLPHQRRAAAATAAAPLSSFSRQCSRLASPPPTVITETPPLEQRGHLV